MYAWGKVKEIKYLTGKVENGDWLGNNGLQACSDSVLYGEVTFWARFFLLTFTITLVRFPVALHIYSGAPPGPALKLVCSWCCWGVWQGQRSGTGCLLGPVLPGFWLSCPHFRFLHDTCSALNRALHLFHFLFLNCKREWKLSLKFLWL